MINKSRITCKCHGVSGSCSMITCWQQLTSIREIGMYFELNFMLRFSKILTHFKHDIMQFKQKKLIQRNNNLKIL